MEIGRGRMLFGAVLLLVNFIPVMAYRSARKSRNSRCPPPPRKGWPRRLRRQKARRGIFLPLRLYEHLNPGSLGLPIDLPEFEAAGAQVLGVSVDQQ